jgi:hypothetical protein
MEDETVGFWHHLELFVLSDDRARWKAIGWIIFVVGLGGCIDFVLLNSSVEDAVFSMATLSVILSIAWFGWYSTFRTGQVNWRPTSPRRLEWQAAVCAAVIAVAVGLWRFQVTTLDSALSQAAQIADYDAAVSVFARARESGVHLNETLVSETSQRFLGSDAQPAAWNALMASLSYKSFLKASSVHPTTYEKPEITTKYNVGTQVGGRRVEGVSVVGIVPAEKAARLNLIGVNENVKSRYGNEFIFVDEGDVVLDGWQMKNVVFRNAHIVYKGGPTVMENVFFLNCTFEIVPQAGGRALASTLLVQNPVTSFRIG